MSRRYTAPCTRLASLIVMLLGFGGFAAVLVFFMTEGAEFLLSLS